jgi:hypothetical protein
MLGTRDGAGKPLISQQLKLSQLKPGAARA